MSTVLHAGAKFTCSVCKLKTQVEKASGASLTVINRNLVTQDDIQSLDLSSKGPGGGCKNQNAPCSGISSILLGDVRCLRLPQGKAVSSSALLIAMPAGMLRFSDEDRPTRTIRLGGTPSGSAPAPIPVISSATQAETTTPLLTAASSNGGDTRRFWRKAKPAQASAQLYWDWVFVGAGQGDMLLSMPRARCAELRTLLSRLKHQRQVLHHNPQRAIDDGWRPFRQQQEAYLGQLTKAETALREANLHATVSLLGLALDLLFLMLGALITTPAAFATLAAASILAGPAKLGVQLFLKLDRPVNLIVAYSGQRMLMLTSLVGNGGPALPPGGGRAGAVLGRIARVVAILWSVKNAVEDAATALTAWDSVNEAKRMLRDLGLSVAPLAEDPMAWARHHDESLGRTIDVLSLYVEATQAADCVFSDSPLSRQPVP